MTHLCTKLASEILFKEREDVVKRLGDKGRQIVHIKVACLRDDVHLLVFMGNSGKHFLALEVVPRATEIAKLGEIDINAFLKSELEKINSKLPAFQRVNKITVRTSDFERTPSMKIVRYKKCQ